MRVVDIDFDTPDISAWAPDDPDDADTWATVHVGDDSGSSSYSVHIVTPLAMKRLADKRSSFLIPSYRGVDDLVFHMQAFIDRTIQAAVGDPYWELARHWQWEYGTYDSRGRLRSP